MQVKVDIDTKKVLNKVHNDKLGIQVSHEWHKLINPYTPKDVGNLMRNVEEQPFLLWYKSPYAHYMYNGIQYVDPQLGVSGIFSTTYGWFSRPNVNKVPTDKPLQYQKNNPYATDHWDIKAARAGQLDKLTRTINNYLRS